MSVLIGHASADENGRAHGGKAGDQTGKEVYTRTWYNGNWSVVLRPKSATVAEKMARFCEAVCANPNVGYNQYRRNTLRTAAKAAGWDGAKISTSCETDCSAFMTVCAEAAGVNITGCYASGNAPVTQTMRAKFYATGAFDALTDKQYLTTDAYLKRGDILVRESGHTAMALSNGSKAAVASTTASTTTTAAAKTCTVQTGDTLWGIAVSHGTTAVKLAAYNGIPINGFIYPGQVIQLP